MKQDEKKELKDLLEQTLIAVRDSASPSLSQVIFTMTEKLDLHIQTHEEDIKDLKKDIADLKISVEPAVSAIDTANNVKRGVIWIAGLIIAFGVVWETIKRLKNG
jgi:tetrahydromethanopterin S-methyltransferase subunit B